MKLSPKKIDKANGKIEVVISNGYLDKKASDVAKKFAKNAKFDGFRKGKVPTNLVMQRYGEQIQEEARQEAINDSLEKGLKELGIAPNELIGQPQVVKFAPIDDGVDVEISFSTRPEIVIDKVESLLPDFKEEEISDNEVDERIADLAKAMAPLEKLSRKRAAKKGDFLTIDFEGFLDGVKFDGGSANDIMVELGAGRFLPDFEANLEGMKIDEEKEFDVAFPADYGNTTLAGKSAQFKAKLKDIQVKADPELNDELAKKMLGDEPNSTLEALKTRVKDEMKSEKMSKIYNETLKPQLIERLIESVTFDLPMVIVEQEAELMFRNKLQTMSKDELEELRNSAEKVQSIKDELKPDASKSVKITFIVDELSRAENISISDEETAQAIYYEAMQMGADPKTVFEHYRDNGLYPAVKMAMLEDKLLTHLLNKKTKAK
jgi:trigger factor